MFFFPHIDLYCIKNSIYFILLQIYLVENIRAFICVSALLARRIDRAFFDIFRIKSGRGINIRPF